MKEFLDAIGFKEVFLIALVILYGGYLIPYGICELYLDSIAANIFNERQLNVMFTPKFCEGHRDVFTAKCMFFCYL